MKKELLRQIAPNAVWFGYDPDWNMRPCAPDDPGACGIIVRTDHNMVPDMSQFAMTSSVTPLSQTFINSLMVLVPLKANRVEDVMAAILIDEAARQQEQIPWVELPLGQFRLNKETMEMDIIPEARH